VQDRGPRIDCVPEEVAIRFWLGAMTGGAEDLWLRQSGARQDRRASRHRRFHGHRIRQDAHLPGQMPYIGNNSELQMANMDILKETKPTLRMEQRISPRDKELIEHAASLQGITPSEFVVSQSVTAARETISRLEVIRLAAEDRDAFLRAFEDEEVNEPLVDVFRVRSAVEANR